MTKQIIIIFLCSRVVLWTASYGGLHHVQLSKQITENILNMLITDLRLLSMVENEQFQRMISTFVLTTDIWTSVATDAYLGETWHLLWEDWIIESHSQTTDNKYCRVAWGCYCKVWLSTRESQSCCPWNGAHVVAAMKILAEKHEWALVWCAGLTQRLSYWKTRLSAQPSSECVATARCLVEHFFF